VFRNDEWEEKFKQCVGGLESIVIDYKEKLSIAKWVLNNFAEIENFIEEHIFRDSKTSDLQEGTESLISNLKRLEKYSEQFEIIDRINESLNTVLGKYKKAESHKENIKKANDVHEKLNRLKDLDKYASALLNEKLDSVSEEMKEIYDDLYPTDPIRLDKIASQKTRAGTKPDYRFRLRWTDELLADAEPVANLGRIRAILWSFVFALIKKHEPVLKTIIIDDPVISLDDYHAQNMVEDIIAKRLSSEYQPIITIHQEGLLHERWGRDPQGKDMGFAKALTRDSNHRSCRIKPSWEPLTNAIENFKDDRDNWLEVIIQARISLENHLKALAPYLSTTDVSSETLDNVVEILRQSRDNKKNSTNICRFVNIGELVRLYESKVAKRVLNISLHGGPDRSNLTPHDADDIVKNHLKWRDDINKRYIEIEKALIRKTSKAEVIVDGISEPANIANLLSKLDAKNQIFQIGEVAAEGQFSVFAEEPSEMPSFDWPSCYYGILTSQGCRPLAWEGQIILVADGLDVNDGDIALVQCAENNFLRRIYQVPINGELDKGWACIAINPALNQIKPEIFRTDEVILYKYVGVLFPSESERLENARLSGGEVVRQTGSWPNVLKSMAKNQLYLVKVKGNSAEPLALDGQYLIIEKTDRYENSLHMAPCCVVLSDERALFKRFCFSVNSEKRALLQPFNVAEPHPVIEIGLSQDINDAEGEAENLPILKQLFLVRGIMIDNPEGLKPLGQ
jgi:SOS-response transcriptional repressor LexA